MSLFDVIGGACGGLKDRALEAAGLAYINQKIQAFGQVTRLQLDSRQKTLFLEVSLKGEVSPITVSASSYSVTEANGKPCVVLQNLTASREWLGAALNQYVAGRPFPIPEALKNAL